MKCHVILTGEIFFFAGVSGLSGGILSCVMRMCSSRGPAT